MAFVTSPLREFNFCRFLPGELNVNSEQSNPGPLPPSLAERTSNFAKRSFFSSNPLRFLSDLPGYSMEYALSPISVPGEDVEQAMEYSPISDLGGDVEQATEGTLTIAVPGIDFFSKDCPAFLSVLNLNNCLEPSNQRALKQSSDLKAAGTTDDSSYIETDPLIQLTVYDVLQATEGDGIESETEDLLFSTFTENSSSCTMKGGKHDDKKTIDDILKDLKEIGGDGVESEEFITIDDILLEALARPSTPNFDIDNIFRDLEEVEGRAGSSKDSSYAISPSLSNIEEGLKTNSPNFKEVDPEEKAGSSSEPNITSRKIDETRIKAVLAFAMQNPTFGKDKVAKELQKELQIIPPITTAEVQRIFEICQIKTIEERREKAKIGDEFIRECLPLFREKKRQRFTSEETALIKGLMIKSSSNLSTITQELKNTFKRVFRSGSVRVQIQKLLKKGIPYTPEKNTLSDPKVAALIKKLVMEEGLSNKKIAKRLQKDYGKKGFCTRHVQCYIQQNSLRKK